jgi:outer membrane protein
MNRYWVLLLWGAVWAGGCTTASSRALEQALHARLVGTNRDFIEQVKAARSIKTTRPVSDVDAKMDPERRAEIDRVTGPKAYLGRAVDLGPDLLGAEGDEAAATVAMTLRRAIHEAVANNLNIEIARLEPAVSQSVIDQALAVFDAVYFADLSWSKQDTPRPSSSVDDVFGSQQTETTVLTTGIRKVLETGGQITLQTELTRNDTDPSFFETNPYYETNVAVAIVQPLLRNFGSDVTRSQIELSRNAKAASSARLRQRLHELIDVTEQSYWLLYFARQRLLIQEQLLERTRSDRDTIEARKDFDVTPAQLTQVRSSFETQRAAVIRARQSVRRASDALKRLINSADLSVSDETLIRPLDAPVDVPIQFSLLDAVSTALSNRPELQEALLAIEDASIRQRVADNQRLPELNLTATVQYSGVGANESQGYDQVTDADFIDYVIQGQFELPIGNRQAEAAYRQRLLERRASVISYQQQAQNVVVQVKNALRDLVVNYELIGAERDARRAAADNLRAIQVQEESGQSLTPEFLDLKLRREEFLAATELRELQALIDYNNAVTSFYRTIGTLLDRNGIDFVAQP